MMVSSLMLIGGKPVSLGGVLARLFGLVTVSAPVSQPPGPMVTAGQTGWWDASSVAGSGTIYSIADQSPAGKAASIGAGAFAEARMCGLLGGIYSRASWPSNYSVVFPIVLDYAVTTTGTAAGSGGNDFTVWLVWSRPNLRQPGEGAFDNSDVAVLTLGGVDVLRMTARGDGTDTLVLFPTLSPVTGGTLELRHTHSVRVVFNGSTVDVWLDTAKVISTANQMTIGATVDLAFLQGAQCVYHEAVTWDHALTDTEHTTLSAYAVRWATGPRRAANMLLAGQSNAGNLFHSSWTYLAYLVRYWTGALSANLLYNNSPTPEANIAGGITTFPGDGLYGRYGDLGFEAKFLINDPNADPSQWQVGSEGQSYQAAIQSLTADQKANLRSVFWFWNEALCSILKYTDKATGIAAHKRAFSLIRSWLGMTAAQLPILMIDPLPFDTSEGAQTYREVIADLANDATQNVVIMLGLAGDAIGMNGGWDPATGIETGYNGASTGDQAHRDFADLDTYMHRCAIPAARAMLAANTACSTPDAITALDASLPTAGGPRITKMTYEGTAYAATSSCLVEVTHDGGTNLKTPLRAASGVGWTLMDGLSSTQSGDPGNQGTLIKALSCSVVDATHLRVVWESVPAFPGKALGYYGAWSNFDQNYFAIIGRGNSVTDDFGSLALAPGWRVSQDKPSASSVPEQLDMPLRATAYGVPLS